MKICLFALVLLSCFGCFAAELPFYTVECKQYRLTYHDDGTSVTTYGNGEILDVFSDGPYLTATFSMDEQTNLYGKFESHVDAKAEWFSLSLADSTGELARRSFYYQQLPARVSIARAQGDRKPVVGLQCEGIAK